MIFCLPLLFADGCFTSLDRITVEQLEKFIPFMVSCSVGRENPVGSVEPLWWPSYLPFSIPLKKPYSINHKWLALLKSLVCRCYTYHGCEFMLRFCTDLTNTPNSVLSFVGTWNDTVSIYSKETGKLVVTLRRENMTYDKRPERAETLLYSGSRVDVEPSCNGARILEIFLCETCDFTFSNLEAALEHDRVCVAPACTTVPFNGEKLVAEKENFLDYHGLRSSASNVVQTRRTSSPINWKMAGVNFTQCCTIPLSSPLGLALHRRTIPSTVSTEVQMNKIEKHCINVEFVPQAHKVRHPDGTWPITWKRNKKSANMWAHTYKFPKKHLRGRLHVPDTGLGAESLKLLQRCKPLSVVLRRLQPTNMKQYPNTNFSKDINGGIQVDKEGCSGENSGGKCTTSSCEKSLFKSYMMFLNPEHCPSKLHAKSAVMKQLSSPQEISEEELRSETTINIQKEELCLCKAQQSERLTVLVNTAENPVTQIPISISKNTDYCSLETISPQSAATLLVSNAVAGCVSTTEFCEFPQYESSSLHIPEARTLQFHPPGPRSIGHSDGAEDLRLSSENDWSQPVSCFLRQKRSSRVLGCRVPPSKKMRLSVPQAMSDSCTCRPRLYPNILLPALPLPSVQKSFSKSRLTHPILATDNCAPLSENVSSKCVRSGTSFINVTCKPYGECQAIRDGEQENVLSTTSSMNDIHKICRVKIKPVSHRTDELDMHQYDSSRTRPSENEELCGYILFCSSSKIRIFTKKQIVTKQKRNVVSRELKRLLQDECKELVSLGLERISVPVKQSSTPSTSKSVFISDLRETEESHREWFTNPEVMCVINFPFQS